MAENDDPHARYQALIAELPDYFANPEADGVVIVTDAVARREAEAEIAVRLHKEGRPRAWARAGVFYEDAWIYFLRDVVRFPGGGLGTHHRIIHKTGPDSVGILPRYRDRLLLLRHFRHGSRDWMLEFPRGGGEPGRTAEETARAELAEEMGADVVSLRRLGFVYPQNNLMMTRIQLFLAELGGHGPANRAEGIAGIQAVTVAELERLIDADIVTDSTSVALYTRARLKGLL